MKNLLLLSLILLSACSSSVTSGGVLYNKPPLSIKDPSPIIMSPVNFKVIHKDNSEKIFSELESKKQEPVLFGLTGSDYKSLSINMQELKSHILLQREIIRKYKEYYEGTKNDKK
jgi:hypothetical protein